MAENVGAKTVVLVHGGFVDGSGWEDVYNILRRDGYTVAVVQNPTISLADDVAVTKRVIDAQTGPVVLVGHRAARGIHWADIVPPLAQRLGNAHAGRQGHVAFGRRATHQYCDPHDRAPRSLACDRRITGPSSS